MAALVGGSLAQVREESKKVTALMRDGALTQLVTGFILVGLVQTNNEVVNNAVVGLKMTFLVAILVLLWLGRKGAFPAMGRMSPDYYVQDGVVPRTPSHPLKPSELR